MGETLQERRIHSQGRKALYTVNLTEPLMKTEPATSTAVCLV
jgi:hypothetical protein